MRAGELRERVTIQTRAERSDGKDGNVETWSPIRRRVAAKVTALVGRELERAQQIDPRSTHEVQLRYWRAYPVEFTARERVIWHDRFDRTLELVEMPRETSRRETLTVLCREAA